MTVGVMHGYKPGMVCPTQLWVVGSQVVDNDTSVLGRHCNKEHQGVLLITTKRICNCPKRLLNISAML